MLKYAPWRSEVDFVMMAAFEMGLRFKYLREDLPAAALIYSERKETTLEKFKLKVLYSSLIFYLCGMCVATVVFLVNSVAAWVVRNSQTI